MGCFSASVPVCLFICYILCNVSPSTCTLSYFELTKLQFVIDYSRDQMYSTSILVTFTTNLKAVFVGFIQDLIIKIPEW